MTACAAPEPYAAATNLDLTDDEQSQRDVLTPRQQREAERAMRSVAEGHQIVARPQPAEHGKRWSDMPAAVAAACVDMEMAVFFTETSPTRHVYHIRTVDSRPVRLVVERTGDERVYTASAAVGRFGDDAAAAEALLAALERQLRAFGRKPRYPES